MSNPDNFLSGGGEMGAVIRQHDWSASPLGPPATWPQTLRTTVRLILSSRHPMFIWWGESLICFYNDAYRGLIGPDRHPRALGRPGAEVWAEIWDVIGPQVANVMAGHGSVWHERQLIPITRGAVVENVWWTYSYSPIDDDAAPDSVGGVLVICRDVTAELIAETSLRERSAGLEEQIQARTRERDRLWVVSQDIAVVVDTKGVFRAVNPATTRVLGWSSAELVGRSAFDFICLEDIAASAEALTVASKEALPSFVNRLRHKDGSVRWLSWVAAPEADRIYCTGRDITAERHTAEQLALAQDVLRQAQKMEAIGQLTGGLAHDFNNLLTGITGSLELLRGRLAEGRLTDLNRYIGAAHGAAQRAASLTHRLLAFSRRQTLAPKPTAINRLIVEIEELLRHTVGPSITIEVIGALDLGTVLIDPGQLESALLNLCINARDAMPDGGRITIETTNRRLDTGAGRARDLPPGNYVALSVTDTGTGMEPEVISRAFDPFFTTKPLGEGTGLGLSMIYGFVRQSGGQVGIHSAPGRGTTMWLFFPRHEGIDAGPNIAETRPAGSRPAPAGTVLVVDDEPTVRMLVVDVLEELGYNTMEAEDGAGGLALLQSAARIDLMITDVGLPGGMNGRQLADAGRVARPGLKVLFITGYAETAVLSHGHLEPGMHVLTKPFALDLLAGKITHLLAA